MAQRRMFSLQIVDTDAFLDMPQSAQLLYFHLSMRADDDGFVGNPKKIMRVIGCGEDDIKILLAKRFILSFESGVIIIKHWRMHNLIRSDRYTETAYKLEKSQLEIKNNNSYTEKGKYEDGIPLLSEQTRPKWQKDREKVYKESLLPYSFSYKIRQAFHGKVCPICEIQMQGYEYSENKRPTIQHNIPISKGGKHELGNISVICKSCNVSIRDKETGSLNSKEVAETWHTIGNQSATQVRLGKVRKGKKDLVEKVIKIKEKNTNTQDLIDLYNSKFEKNTRITPQKKTLIKRMLKSYTLEELKKAITSCSQSKFHCGENDRGWVADFNYIFRNEEQVDKMLNLDPEKFLTREVIVI